MSLSICQYSQGIPTSTPRGNPYPESSPKKYDIENIDSYKYKNNKNKIEGNVGKQLSDETLKNKLKKNIALEI